jgi:predicted nuclease of predicted toxin-antitoxin system
VAGGFRILTDENIAGPVAAGLAARGWDVVRAIDVFGERSDDDAVFEWAVRNDRVLVTTDADLLATAQRWLAAGRLFRIVYWHPGRHQRVRTGAFVDSFEALARKKDAFAAGIEYLRLRA